MKKFNLSKARDIQPETLLKSKHFSVAPSVLNNLTNLVP